MFRPLHNLPRAGKVAQQEPMRADSGKSEGGLANNDLGVWGKGGDRKERR